MRFNKYLAMCFLTSTLMCGSFTSCGDDEDDNETEVSSFEQGRADGQKFGENYQIVMGSGEELDKTAAALSLISAAGKYKNSTDNTYKTAFAEGAVEVVTGNQEKGDAAIDKMNGLLNGLDALGNLKDDLTGDDSAAKANAIMKLIDLFSKKN